MSAPSVKIAGQLVALGKPLGRGGEGDVYALAGEAGKAVKLYKENLRRSREAKVRAMVQSKLAEKTALVAFPSAVATDKSGSFAGFAMRLVAGYRPIHELYGPKSRKIHFPQADYRFLVRAAQNIARAVASVHQSGCVIGDFNHSGVLVAGDATVALIDADSFQFEANGTSYPCVVGTEDFTPPELHGKSLGQVKRSQAHDNFGLAVAIFLLLGMGKHPYAGRYSGADLSLGEAIAQHRFAYSVARKSSTRTTPPPGAIKLEDFPAPIAHAFEAAFGLTPGARPDAPTWITLLGELERSLRRCSRSTAHYFPQPAGSCVWCRMAGLSGVEMFPGGSFGGAPPPSSGGPFDLRRIEVALGAISLPRSGALLPSWNGPVGEPSQAFGAAKQAQNAQRALGVAALVGALIAWVLLPSAAIFWIALGIFGAVRLAHAKVDPTPLRKAYAEAESHVASASRGYLQTTGLVELAKVRSDMDLWVAQYKALDAELANELARLRSTREERQRNDFLDRFLLRSTKIPGIGPAKLSALASFGIESAADISYSAVIAVSGFGEALTQKLLDWRRQQERKFRFNPAATPADSQAENAAQASVAAKRAQLEGKLRSGLASLQAGAAQVNAKKLSPSDPLYKALQERARLERDFRVLGITPPAQASTHHFQAPPQVTQPTYRTPSPPPSRPASGPASGPPSCPTCGSRMVRRTARRGHNRGSQFWGCSRYPHCRGNRP